jgi:hypothetical protein
MKLPFTYWEASEGGYIGCLTDYPDYHTEGETLEELKMMLASLYDDILSGDIPGIRRVDVLDYEAKTPA